MSNAKYTVRWTVCAASDVGSPQVRRRWYCLCVKHGYAMPSFSYGDKYDWSSKASPPLITVMTPINSRRFALLGNAVVPSAARYAFVRMLSGFRTGCYDAIKSTETVHYETSVEGKIVEKIPIHGELSNKSSYIAPVVAKNNACHREIILDPEHYDTNATYQVNSLRTPAPLLHTPKLIQLWPTPRATLATHSHNLSERTVRDLPTAAMYASKVDGKKQHKTRDGQGINPRFVEWLMGFPMDWTRFTQ